MDTQTIQLPAGYDDVRDRDALTSHLPERLHGFQVESIGADGQAMLIHGTPSSRPGAITMTLAPTTSPAAAPQLAAYLSQQGADLVEWLPFRHEAVSARLTPAVRDLRARFARVLKCQPWDIEISAEWAVDALTGEGRIDRVVITRVPSPNADPDRRMSTWRALLSVIPGTDGWRVAESHTGVVTLTYGQKRELPGLVPAESLLLDAIDPTKWNSLPLGITAHGSVASLDFLAGPHAVVTGGTGSGKSVSLRLIILGAIARGFDVIFVDPIKRGAGLKSLIPYTRGFYVDGIPQAAHVLEAVYAEVRRRVDLIDSAGVEAWYELPAESAVRPVLLVIDEYGSLVTPPEKLAGLPKDHPKMVEYTDLVTAKALIKGTVGQIAREARSAGIHAVLSLQRPDADVIGGSIRENLGSIVQLVVPARPPSREALGMLFPGDNTAAAQSEIADLNDGESKGLALSYVDGGGVEGFRVGLIEKGDMAPYLEAIGAPLATPFLPVSAPASPTPDFWS